MGGLDSGPFAVLFFMGRGFEALALEGVNVPAFTEMKLDTVTPESSGT